MVEKARGSGSTSEFLRREVELINRRLDSLKDFLDIIDVERVVRHIREDGERR